MAKKLRVQPILLLLMAMTICITGCRSAPLGTEISPQPRELSRACETVYDHGPMATKLMIVFADGDYEWQEYRRGMLEQRIRYGALHKGHIDPELLEAVRKSINSDPQWETVGRLHIFYGEVDMEWPKSNPECMGKLFRIMNLYAE